MHPHSQNSWQLAVPGIGFPQPISIGADAFDLADCGPTERSDAWRYVEPVAVRGLQLAIRTILTMPSSIGR